MESIHLAERNLYTCLYLINFKSNVLPRLDMEIALYSLEELELFISQQFG